MSLTNKELTELKSLIGENKTDIVLEKLLSMLKEQHNDLFNEVILKLQQYNKLKKEVRTGVIDSAASNLQFNQINYYLLETIDEIEKSFLTDSLPAFSAKHIEERVEYFRPIVAFLQADIQEKEINYDYIEQNKLQLDHLLKLKDIHAKNLRMAEEAIAKWGELAPPILIHRKEESLAEIEKVKAQLTIHLNNINS